MATTAEAQPGINVRLQQLRTFAIPIAFVGLFVVLVVPLPPVLMDIFITFNIAFSAVVLLTTVYLSRPLDFSVFPSLLLAATLLRLVLNVATTRLILSTEASTPEEAQFAAGHVIAAFGNFVAGDSVIVGTVIFIILVVIQFVVITKGSTRVSEVAARFTLDAMPGKQMAIDADLTAGLISEAEARARRESVMREADFYGAMDGASKFVRGDAIAGIVITLINVLGGFAVGAFSKGWGIGQSLEVFTRLTIGDGLVSQIPAFIIAIASGLIVTRSGAKEDFNQDITGQLTAQPKALFVAAAFLAIMSVTGLPFLPMLGSALVIGMMGWFVSRQKVDAEAAARRAAATAKESAATAGPAAPTVDDLLKVDLLELEVGYGLVPMVNQAEGGSLLDRISAIRRQLAAELGLVLPPVRIRDNAQMSQWGYRVKIRGSAVAGGEVYPGQWMAMDSGIASGRLEGNPTREPAFGLDAMWIEPHQRAKAESLGYTVVDATSVLMTHFTEIVKTHGDELLTRQEIANLITNLKERAPKLVEETIPEKVKPAELQRVLQALLRERAPIRDTETIVETLAEWSAQTKDTEILVEYVRHALRRSIAAQHVEQDAQGVSRLYCVTIDPRLEDTITSYIDRSGGTTTNTMPPAMTAKVASAIAEALKPLVQAGHQPILLTSPQVRGPLRKMLQQRISTIVVLGYNEIPPGLNVESLGLAALSAKDEVAAAAAA